MLRCRECPRPRPIPRQWSGVDGEYFHRPSEALRARCVERDQLTAERSCRVGVSAFTQLARTLLHAAVLVAPSVVRTWLILAQLRHKRRTSECAWMVAAAILHKLQSIWCMNFPGKVPLLALNVGRGAITCESVLLILLFLVSGSICFEEFVEGSMVARLSCLCSFHKGKHQVQIVCRWFSYLCRSVLVLLASAW